MRAAVVGRWDILCAAVPQNTKQWSSPKKEPHKKVNLRFCGKIRNSGVVTLNFVGDTHFFLGQEIQPGLVSQVLPVQRYEVTGYPHESAIGSASVRAVAPL